MTRFQREGEILAYQMYYTSAYPNLLAHFHLRDFQCKQAGSEVLAESWKRRRMKAAGLLAAVPGGLEWTECDSSAQTNVAYQCADAGDQRQLGFQKKIRRHNTHLWSSIVFHAIFKVAWRRSRNFQSCLRSPAYCQVETDVDIEDVMHLIFFSQCSFSILF